MSLPKSCVEVLTSLSQSVIDEERVTADEVREWGVALMGHNPYSQQEHSCEDRDLQGECHATTKGEAGIRQPKIASKQAGARRQRGRSLLPVPQKADPLLSDPKPHNRETVYFGGGCQCVALYSGSSRKLTQSGLGETEQAWETEEATPAAESC